MSSAASSAPPLSQAVGYGILLGLGFGFALVMIGVTLALKRYHNEGQSAEESNTAGRTVKSGLVAAAMVSGSALCLVVAMLDRRADAVQLDMGRNPASINRRGVQIRHQRALLVCVGGDGADHPLRDAGH